MTEIIPAILPKSYSELEEKLGVVAGHAPVVQIDICDGAYVSNRTWPYLKGVSLPDGHPVDQIFADIVSQERALPHWEELDFEFDLMVRGAHQKIPDFISAGASRIVVHKHSMTDSELVDVVRDFGKHSEELGPFDIELGVALMPGDVPDSIAAIANKIHFVQVMGIDRIGFQGQTLNPRALELVKALKTAYPQLTCVVDGHVDLNDARELVDAGARRLVVGSALFESSDFLGTLDSFYDAIAL